MYQFSVVLLVYVTASSVFHHAHCSTYAVALLGCHLNHGNETNTVSSQYELVVINTDTHAIKVNVTKDHGKSDQHHGKIMEISWNFVEEGVSTTLRMMSIPANGEKIFNLDGIFGLNGSEFTNKTVMVTSRSNFTLYVFSTSVSHSEGFVGIPLEDLLGPHKTYDVYDYVVATFCSPYGYCQLAVSAFQNATVKFKFPKRVSDIVYCMRLKYFRSSRDTVLKMAAYDVVQMESTQDMTGTHIYSFSPIAVFVGARNLTNKGKVVHLIEQLPTATQWDKDFIVTPLGDSSYGDIIKITTSTWNSTVVEMSGYGRFLLSGVDVLTRRISPDTYATITSDNPIQVVQIAGFVDDSTDVSGSTGSHLTLAIVQGSRQVVSSSKISCGAQQNSLKVVVITGKTNDVPRLNGIRMSVANEMGVSGDRIYTKSGHGLTINELKGEGMTGLVQCENGAAFPLGNKYTFPATMDEQESSSHRTCIEGETFHYIDNMRGYSDQIISERSFEGFSVLKLRVQFCGAVIVEFKMDMGSVIIRLTSHVTTVTMCTDGVCDVTYEVENEFNERIRICEKDMAWYWFRQSFANDSFSLEVGFGPIVFEPGMAGYVYRVRKYYVWPKSNLEFVNTIPLPGELKNFTMKGLLTNAFFNYDLEPEGGCTRLVSDWRCEDNIEHCDFYGENFCRLPEFSKFSEVFCPRYCGICIPDMFGKRFVGIFPVDVYYNVNSASYLPWEIYLKQINRSNEDEPNIAIATEKCPLHRRFNTFSQETMVFSCDSTLVNLERFWIISDTDIQVTVSMFDSATNRAVLYSVYPTDTYDNEYMTIGHSNKSFCDVITEYEHASVLLLIPNDIYVEDKGSSPIAKSDILMISHAEPVKLYIKTSNENAGGIFLKSDYPISVFCGEMDSHVYYNQLLPSRILSTSYRIPNFDLSSPYRPRSVNMIVQALQPDTIVQFRSDFGNVAILETEGDKSIVEIDPNSTHELISNNPIAVAMSYESYSYLSGFILIAPVNCFDADADVFFDLDNIVIEGYFITNLGEPYHTLMHHGDVTQIKIFGTAGTEADSHFGIMIAEMPQSPAIFTTSFIFRADEQGSKDVCEISRPTANDSIDNDCDGYIDEDVCCQYDYDLDGDFSDDFNNIFEDHSNVPPEPICIPINKPDHQCWTLCQCPCSWVENLLEASKMSHDEFISTQMVKAMKIQEQLTVYTKNLTKVTAQKTSAVDSRQSAANVGYVGVALFMLTVAFIIFLDISAILRDLKIFFSNLKDGFERLRHCVCCK